MGVGGGRPDSRQTEKAVNNRHQVRSISSIRAHQNTMQTEEVYAVAKSMEKGERVEKREWGQDGEGGGRGRARIASCVKTESHLL